MTYVGLLFAAVVAAPAWVWLGLVSACAELAILGMWFAEHRRALAAERAAVEARANARLWQVLAEARAAGRVLSKRTVVAPQYHAPRGP
jgi:hypothetical protein